MHTTDLIIICIYVVLVSLCVVWTTPPSVMLQCILQIIKLLFCWKFCCPWRWEMASIASVLGSTNVRGKEICWWLLKRVQTVWIQMSEPWDLSWICVQSFHNGPNMPKVSAFGNQSTDSISAFEDLSFHVRQFHAKSMLGRAVLQELELFVAIVFEQGNPWILISHS